MSAATISISLVFAPNIQNENCCIHIFLIKKTFRLVDLLDKFLGESWIVCNNTKFFLIIRCPCQCLKQQQFVVKTTFICNETNS